MFQRSALSLLLHQERERRRASSIQYGGFMTPLLAEWIAEPEVAPVLATDPRGSLVAVKTRDDGGHRLGFFACDLTAEDTWLAHAARWALSAGSGSVRCFKGIEEAIRGLLASGFPPVHLVVSWEDLVEADPGVSVEGAKASMAVQGFITETDGLKVLGAPLDKGTRILVGSPAMAGLYIRSDDRLAVALWRANTAWAWVRA